MNKGDIIIVPAIPCPGNDVLDVMRGNQDYPVYGVVRGADPDDEAAGVLVHVIDSEGITVESGWWFGRDEVQILEEAPPEVFRDNPLNQDEFAF